MLYGKITVKNGHIRVLCCQITIFFRSLILGISEPETTEMQSIIKSLSIFTVEYFFQIWVVIPAILSLYCIFWIYKNISRPLINPSRENIKNKLLIFSKITFTDLICVVAFLIFVGIYILSILYREDFAYHDNSMFTYGTLLRKSIPKPIWLNNGRFFPLGHQEFDIIKFVCQSPTGYHAFPVLQLLAVLAILFVLFDGFKVWVRLLLITLVMTIPSFVISFFGLIFPERNLIFWLLIFLFCYLSFSKTKSNVHYCFALIAVHCFLYLKEPAFALIGGFSGTRLLLNKVDNPGTNRHNRYYLFFKENLIDISLLILACLFLLLYIITSLPNPNLGYAGNKDISRFFILTRFLICDPLLGVFLLSFTLRLFYLIYQKKPLNRFWDPLAIGAILYFLTFIVLKLFRVYYTAIIDLIAILYLFQMISQWLQKKREVVLSVVTCILVCFVFVHHAVFSFFYILERKNLIEGKVQLAGFLEEYAKNGNDHEIKLFFPNVNGYYLMELSGFLEYKGLQLAKNELPVASAEPIFRIEGSREFRNNLCINYRKQAKCYHADGAESGHLIVVIPEDNISEDRFNGIKNESILLYHYKGIFSNSNRLERFLRRIGTTSFHTYYAPGRKLWGVYVFQVL